jgi:hypothetical protein
MESFRKFLCPLFFDGSLAALHFADMTPGNAGNLCPLNLRKFLAVA